jgi:hypothetical protein
MSLPIIMPLSEVKELVSIYLKSGLASNIKSVEQGVIIAMLGMEMGMQPLHALRSLHIMDGKPVLGSEALVALVHKSGRCKYFRCAESTTEKAVFETMALGDPQPTTLTFTIEDAKRAGLAGRGPWQKYPQAMLRARCAMALARAHYPDAVMGALEEGEARDIAADRDNVAVKVEAPKAKQEQVETMDLEAIINGYRVRLRSVQTMADLDNLAQEISLQEPNIKNALRELYKQRKGELEAAIAQVS